MNQRAYSLTHYVLAALVTALCVSGLMLTASCSEIASGQLEPPNVVWVDMQANLPRDDEGTENLGEDDYGWNCQTMGNQVCGYTDPVSGTLFRYYYGI